MGQRLIIPMSGRIVPRAAWNGPADPAAATRRTVTTTRGTNTATTTISASHRVRNGETASQIARRFGVTLRALLDYNDLTATSIIKAGQVLHIPPVQTASQTE